MTWGFDHMTTDDIKHTPPASDNQADNEAAGSQSWVEHPKNVQRLQILVIALAVVLIAGFIAVIARIAFLALQPVDAPNTSAISPTANATGSPDGPNPQTLDLKDVSLPTGAKIEHLATGADTLAIHFRLPDGSQQITIIDTATGETRQRLRIRSDSKQ